MAETIKHYGHTRWFRAEIVPDFSESGNCWNWHIYDNRLPQTETNWIYASGGCKTRESAIEAGELAILQQISELQKYEFYVPKEAVTLMRSCDCCGSSFEEDYDTNDVFIRLNDTLVKRKGHIENDEYYQTGGEWAYEHEIYDRLFDDLFERYYLKGIQS